MLSRALRFTLTRSGVRFNSAVALSAGELEAKKTGDYTKVDRVEDWENFKMPAQPYVGMGPTPPAPSEISEAGQTRMVFFPESYFKLLEPKLGYTGAYTLLWGSILFATSKEIMVFNPEYTWTFSAFIFVGAAAHHLLIPGVDRETHITNVVRNEQVNLWKDYKMAVCESTIDGTSRMKEQADGLNLVQQQRKTNLALALEAEYMNRQADLTDAVKKRLDYQVALNNAEREAMSKHMINWVESQVQAAIGKRSAKDDLASAIAQLKTMVKA